MPPTLSTHENIQFIYSPGKDIPMSPSISWLNGRREPDINVYVAKRPLQCSECHEHIAPIEMFTRNEENPLCLTCSGLDGLQFLPAGSTSVTGLAMGFTGRKISVISEDKPSPKRIGILATEEAILKARERSQAIASTKAARLSQMAEPPQAAQGARSRPKKRGQDFQALPSQT